MRVNYTTGLLGINHLTTRKVNLMTSVIYKNQILRQLVPPVPSNKTREDILWQGLVLL